MALDMEGFDEFSNFEMDENLVNELRMDEDFGIPWQMTDFDVWNNYCDQRLYELDKTASCIESFKLIKLADCASRTRGFCKLCKIRLILISLLFSLVS